MQHLQNVYHEISNIKARILFLYHKQLETLVQFTIIITQTIIVLSHHEINIMSAAFGLYPIHNNTGKIWSTVHSFQLNNS